MNKRQWIMLVMGIVYCVIFALCAAFDIPPLAPRGSFVWRQDYWRLLGLLGLMAVITAGVIHILGRAKPSKPS